MTWTQEVLPQTTRQRTGSTLKWLLSERAATRGRLATLDKSLPLLNQQLVHARRRAALLEERIAVAKAGREDAVAALLAMDQVLERAYSSVNPDAAGVVQAWAGRYGSRGGLKEFVLEFVQKAAPAAVSTAVLVQAATAQFGLELDSPAKRSDFRKYLRTTLKRWHRSVEELPSERARGTTHWRWRGVLTVSDLLDANQHEAAHSLSPEMGGERTGGSYGRD